MQFAGDKFVTNPWQIFSSQNFTNKRSRLNREVDGAALCKDCSVLHMAAEAAERADGLRQSFNSCSGVDAVTNLFGCLSQPPHAGHFLLCSAYALRFCDKLTSDKFILSSLENLYWNWAIAEIICQFVNLSQCHSVCRLAGRSGCRGLFFVYYLLLFQLK